MESTIELTSHCDALRLRMSGAASSRWASQSAMAAPVTGKVTGLPFIGAPAARSFTAYDPTPIKPAPFAGVRAGSPPV